MVHNQEQATKDYLVGRKNHCAKKLEEAFNMGFLPKVERFRGLVCLPALTLKEVEDKIEYLEGLIQTKTRNKAA